MEIGDNMKNKFLLLLLAFFSIMIFGCKPKEIEKKEVSFELYKPKITASTLIQGKHPSLEIYFDASVAPIDYKEQNIASFITISPEIKGEWDWVNDSHLVFMPAESWKLNTKYKISFTDNLLSSNVVCSWKSDSFTTPSYEVWMDDAEFYIDPNDPSVKRVTFSLSGNIPFSDESFADKISLKLEQDTKKDSKNTKTTTQTFNFDISFNEDKTTAYIISEPIPMPLYTSKLYISVKSGIKSIFGVGVSQESFSDSVSIPGMNDYANIEKITHDLVKNEEQNYDQVLFLKTKGEIRAEDLKNHISIYELPVDKPKDQGYKEVKNFSWDESYVSDYILSLSKKIDFEIIPSETNYSSINSIKIKANPNRYIYIKIAGNIEFYGGYKWNDVFEDVLRLKQYPRELGILSEGTILSLSGSKKMALYSRGINDISYKIYRVMPKDINHLVSMSNGDMKNFKFSSYRFDEDNITESVELTYKIPSVNSETITYFSFDFTSHLTAIPEKNMKNGLFIFVVKDNNSSKQDKRLILVTDLGFFVKKNADKTKDIFVQSIATGKPVPNASVRILGLNGNTVYQTYTDYTGHASISDLSNLSGEHSPVAYIVEYGKDLSFMPYEAEGRTLDYSNFDVGGIYESNSAEKINAFLFNDRGIYRPGEEINIGMILKAGDWKTDLSNIPLEISVEDSKGSEFFVKQITNDISGFNEVTFSTKQYSPTGKYTVSLYLIRDNHRSLLASDSFNVEEFLPDTLNLQIGFSPLTNSAWINPGKLKGEISLRNLFGTPASGNTVKGKVSLQPGFPNLAKYEDYRFSDPYQKYNNYEEALGELKTDDNGHCEFDIDVEKFEKATYLLSMYVEAFEKGSGRNVSKQTQVLVSPLSYVIGYKADGSLSYIEKEGTRQVSIIAVDKELNKIKLDDVTLHIEEEKYVSALVKQPNGLYKYQSVKKGYPIKDEKISIPQNGYDFIIPTEKEGEYTVYLYNKEGIEFNKFKYSVVGDKNISRSLERNAELEVTLDKSDFSGGDTAKVFIKAPYAGAGLITIERDKVYSWKWFSTTELSTVQTIEIPKELEGNAYINVMFTRSASSEEIFMSPFCFGTVPFSISREKRTNKINLEVPSEIKSGEDLIINYSTSENSKIVIYAVDEGILQVGNYKTPDPLEFFFRKKALQVKTSQIMDLVLPDYNVLKTVSAFGGGADMEMLKANLNPFSRKVNKPVVFWSGILDSGKETKSVKYTVPDYFNGSIRIMAIAVSPNTVGTAQTSTTATNTFIMTNNAPLAVSPNDKFDVALSVTNNFKGSGENAELTISLENSENLTVLTDKTVKVKIPEGKDEVINFVVKAENLLGNGELKFIATGKLVSGEEEKSVYTTTLTVRPAMPYQTWIQSGSTKKALTELQKKHITYEEYSQRVAAVSNMPTGFVDGLDFYLAKYPYGCSEQITSKAYPYIYEEVAKIAGKTKAEVNAMVEETISILQSRTKPDGNIGYWTNKTPTDEFITLYCAEFLTDAQLQGFFVPTSFMNKVLSAVKKIAADSEGTRTTYSRAYAIYILTKNEEITTQYIEDLEKKVSILSLDSEYEKLYLAASYSMMMQKEKAEKYYYGTRFDMLFDSSWDYHNELHYNSVYIDIISEFFPDKVKTITEEQILSFCNKLNSNNYNTLSCSTALKALISYSKLISDNEKVYELYQVVNGEEKKLSFMNSSDNEKSKFIKKANFDSNAEKILFKNNSDLLMYYQVVEGGYEITAPEKPINNGIEVYKTFYNEKGEKISSIKVGDTVMVSLNIRSTDMAYLNNVAIIDLACAGLEVDIESVRNSNSQWEPDYIDIREDRVVLYGPISNKINNFTYYAKAICSGEFVVPSLYAESMYNGDIKGIDVQKTITIKK